MLCKFASAIEGVSDAVKHDIGVVNAVAACKLLEEHGYSVRPTVVKDHRRRDCVCYKKLLPKMHSQPKILVLDIESKPLLGYFWGLWDQNISMQQIVEHGGMMCFAAKWLGKPDVEFYSEYHHGKQAMLEAAHRLLSEADVVITYNGDRYDVRRLNNEFMLAGMNPPKPFKSIDLIKTNKNRFDLPSRKLDYLVQQSGVGAKVKHQGFELWTSCMAGDAEAWKTMKRYNEGDVRVTERGYLRILPWITNAPHLGMFIAGAESCCPYCGSKKLKRDGTTHANVTSYKLYECQNCHGWVRGTTRLADTIRTRAAR